LAQFGYAMFWGMEQSSPQDAKLTILTSNIRLV